MTIKRKLKLKFDRATEDDAAELAALHQTIRLDAYDAPAGAGPFYSRCGFREMGRVIYRKVPLVYFEQLL